MKKMALVLALTFLASPVIAEEWMVFKLIERPYYDESGNILESIENRKNRDGIDKFTGGGKVYPSIMNDKSKVLKTYEKGADILMRLDISNVDAKKIKDDDRDLMYKASPIVIRDYKATDFSPAIVTDEEAEVLKETVFGVKKLSGESGVTK